MNIQLFMEIIIQTSLIQKTWEKTIAKMKIN